MKQVELRVIVTFGYKDNEIKTAEHLKEIAENIAYAIKEEADRGIGIAPENSGAFTTGIYVNPVTAPEHRIELEIKNGLGWVRTI